MVVGGAARGGGVAPQDPQQRYLARGGSPLTQRKRYVARGGVRGTRGGGYKMSRVLAGFLEHLKNSRAKSEHVFGDAPSPLYNDQSPAVRNGGAALRSAGVKTK